MAVFLARIVMPRSRSSSFESIIRSTCCSLARNVPLCCSMASTSVVLPWSTCAMMAMLRMRELKNDPARNVDYYYFTMRGVNSPRKTRLLKDLSSRGSRFLWAKDVCRMQQTRQRRIRGSFGLRSREPKNDIRRERVRTWSEVCDQDESAVAACPEKGPTSRKRRKIWGILECWSTLLQVRQIGLQLLHAEALRRRLFSR